MLKSWRFWLGAIISALFLGLALRGLDLGYVWTYAVEANYWWIVPGVLAYTVAVWARTWRWHYLLRPIKAIPLRSMWPVVVIGYMGNNVYPFRAGEVLRAYVLKRKEGVSISASLATILVERIFDGLVMLLFVFIALPSAPGLPAWLRQTVILASVAFFTALLLFLIMAAQPEQSRRLYTWAIHHFVPTGLQARVLVLADRFMEGLSSLSRFQDISMIFATSVVIWLLETVKYWFVMHAFNFTVSFFALMLMNGVVNLATTIPSAPGYIGTFDGPGIEVLVVFGVPRAIAAAYTLVLHAALWLPITLLGFYYMARESLGWRDFDKAVQVGESLDEEVTSSSEANRPGATKDISLINHYKPDG
ncbi:MAG TPA: lysylphosphatidylglycerol synthase transmembrane domain-containing protein [Anaerolineae bacterium]|nr:lysylphosphatidylglycerol synthase transmembrane domain-containing protein [Anaerolineae bacterium]